MPDVSLRTRAALPLLGPAAPALKTNAGVMPEAAKEAVGAVLGPYPGQEKPPAPADAAEKVKAREGAAGVAVAVAGAAGDGISAVKGAEGGVAATLAWRRLLATAVAGPAGLPSGCVHAPMHLTWGCVHAYVRCGDSHLCSKVRAICSA
jgi:hypothetical protein